MDNTMSLQQQFQRGIRKLDEQYADYLYDLRQELSALDALSIGDFLFEVEENGAKTLVFLHQKGKGLRNDIRREVIALHEALHGKA